MKKGCIGPGVTTDWYILQGDNAGFLAKCYPKGPRGKVWVNAIEISAHDPATAYIATTKYKFNDYAPAIYKRAKTNYGTRVATDISSGIPYGAFTKSS